MPDRSPLAAFAAAHRDQIAHVAEAWLAMGATSFGLRQDDAFLCHWPPDGRPPSPDVVAPIQVSGFILGELAVEGLAEASHRQRLRADADMLAQVALLETEIEGLAAELIDRQDQLLAMYDLTQSMRTQVRIDDVLRALVHEAVRLTRSQAGFAVLSRPGRTPLLVQDPEAFASESALLELFFEASREGRDRLFDTSIAVGALPRGIQQLLILPIELQGSILAGLGLSNKLGGFSSPDRKLARAIADQGGARIENAVLYSETIEQARLRTELDLAARIQLRLLPQTLPAIRGLDLCARSDSALYVGGDFYDFIQRNGRPLTFAVGDVAGKGMPAALLMSITHTVINNVAKFISAPTPATLLSRVNEDLYDDFTDVGLFATVFAGRFDPRRREMLYANAGHSPVVYRPQGGTAQLLLADAPPVGVVTAGSCIDRALTFNPGDLLVIATDGLTEATSPDGEMFGNQRLLECTDELAAESASTITEKLFEAIHRFSAGQTQDDDQTVVVVKGVE